MLQVLILELPTNFSKQKYFKNWEFVNNDDSLVTKKINIKSGWLNFFLFWDLLPIRTTMTRWALKTFFDLSGIRFKELWGFYLLFLIIRSLCYLLSGRVQQQSVKLYIIYKSLFIILDTFYLISTLTFYFKDTLAQCIHSKGFLF